MSNIDQALKIIVDTITTIGNPDKIILFGSQARGDANVDSDIDIMVIEDSDLPKYFLSCEYSWQIHKKRMNQGISFPMDLIVLNNQDIINESESLISIVPSSLAEGRVLYER